MDYRVKHAANNRASTSFPLVCGSAGVLNAYIRLLEHLPADLGMAIVIVNHVISIDGNSPL